MTNAGVDADDSLTWRVERERTAALLARVTDLYENAPIGYVTLDERGAIQQANRMAAELLGAPLTALKNQLLSDCVSAEHRAALDRFMTATFSDSARASTTVEVVSSSRPLRWCQLDADRSGGETTCRVTITDVTALKRSDASRKASERLAAAALDALSANIAIIDEVGTILTVNRNWTAFARESGVADSSVGVGRNYFEVCDAAVGPDRELARAVGKGLRDVTSGRISEFKQEYPCHAPKRKQWFVIRATRFVGPGPIRLIIAHQDVTERVELEAQLLQSQKMETVGQLAGGIAHDFNNLLTIINGSVDLALSAGLDPERAREELTQVAQAGARAARLTSQLLAFSRKQMMRFEVLDLRTLMEPMVELLRRIIGDEITLELDLPTVHCPVSVDGSKLEQVVMNLVVNSRDAMPGGGTITLRVRRAQVNVETASRCAPPLHEGAYVILEVVDTGSGIDDFDLPHVFEPFYTTKPEGVGTGLGLSTVYGVISHCGGGVLLDTRVGHGTSVGIYLPLAGSAMRRNRRRTPGPSLEGAGETVLVVEDEAALNALASRVLTTYGYVTLSAASGREALEILQARAGAIDLMFTDVVMPGMSGPDLAAAARQRWPALRVLFTSGYSDTSFLATVDAGGGHSFIPKPWLVKELLAHVRGALDAPVA